MKNNLLTYCKLRLVKSVSKKLVHLLCRCAVSRGAADDDGGGDDDDDKHYYKFNQFNNNCNFIYININN
uniref:DekiORF82 n=1 Tax=Dendrolimus kikuchii nucleopolyhedrovirus TaxID=1219875 RepID=V9LSZ4_9ABAC|nr:DekiORF82 [Dendrolimus kikuchii nucleopolyhedrovirus]